MGTLPPLKKKSKVPSKKRLHDLDGSLLQLTTQRGVLRCMRPGQDGNLSQGLYFICPKSLEGKVNLKDRTVPAHAITILFALSDVPDDLQPKGRWMASGSSLHNLCVLGPVPCTHCDWKGSVLDGEVIW
jgi:hypothetical protein